jgi:hypothetical protein
MDSQYLGEELILNRLQIGMNMQRHHVWRLIIYPSQNLYLTVGWCCWVLRPEVEQGKPTPRQGAALGSGGCGRGWGQGDYVRGL